jgi:hypothetical protein
MKRNTLIAGIALAVLLVALVFTAGCEDLEETGCDAMSDKDRDHCNQKLAVMWGNITRCEDIKGAGPGTKCIALVAQKNNNAFDCLRMDNSSWKYDREAYHREDCLLYVARNSNNIDACRLISSDFHGQATDLNPRMQVTQKNCWESLQCGKTGQPACYNAVWDMYGYPVQNEMNYVCGEVRYPQPVTCP